MKKMQDGITIVFNALTRLLPRQLWYADMPVSVQGAEVAAVAAILKQDGADDAPLSASSLASSSAASSLSAQEDLARAAFARLVLPPDAAATPANVVDFDLWRKKIQGRGGFNR